MTMKDRHRRWRLLALCLALLPVVSLPARADGSSLLLVGQWRVQDSGGAALAAVAFDDVLHVGYVLSSTGDPQAWDQVQAVDAASGRPLSPNVSIPRVLTRSPLHVDTKRHVLIYPAAPANSDVDRTVAATAAPRLVGLGWRGGAVRVLFTVASRTAGEQLDALAPDSTARDLLVVGVRLAVPSVARTTPMVTVDRISLDALTAGRWVPRWTAPYQLPTGMCPELLGSALPPALLVTGDRLDLACRPPTPTRHYVTAGQQAGVVELSGVTAKPDPSIAARLFQASGAFGQTGESYADPATRRLVLLSTDQTGVVARVFDTDHSRYVGTILASGQGPAGVVSDPRSGRLYFAGQGSHGSLAEADLRPVVPTQAEVHGSPFGLMIGAAAHRLAFHEATGRLFLPYHAADGRNYLGVVKDVRPPYAAPPEDDPDAGGLDVPEQPGVTESTRAASASGFGASYALIGGAGGLYRNTTGIQDNGTLDGTRSLRQAVVRSTTLTGDAATASAVIGVEDDGTDANRTTAGQAASPAPVDPGSAFAPEALCADFGAGKADARTVLSASVDCDLSKARSAAAVDVDLARGLLMTVPGTPQLQPLPVRVGHASTSVEQTRLAPRGVLQSTVTATARNVELLGIARIASVTSTVTVSAHGRRGTALAAPPKVELTGVVVQGEQVCTGSCSLDQVQAALNAALGAHGQVEFPQAQVISTPGGTYAAVAQDPWYHAERMLDLGIAADDLAVPAMTVTVYLEGELNSRLVVELAAVRANARYQISALRASSPGSPPHGGTAAAPLPLSASPAAPPGSLLPPPGPHAAGVQIAATGVLHTVTKAVQLGWRSVQDGLPVLLVWSLLALGPYLAARRRLLLELPTLALPEER